MGGDRRRPYRSTLAGAVVVALGVAFTASHVRHVLLMQDPLGMLLQAVVPLALSVGIIGAGVVVAGGVIDDADAGRFAGWVLAGVVLLLLVALWMLFHGLTRGHPSSHGFALAVNAATVGALLGILIGTYDAQRLQSERALQAQNERLDRFAGIVSHDLRNPLGVAIGRLELARSDDDGENLATAAAALERMDRLVDDVLALAQSGDDVVDPEPLSLGPVVQTAWDSTETEAATLTIADDLDRVEGDPGRIQQLFENLFRNAVEHSSTSSRAQPDDGVEHGSTSPRSSSTREDAVDVEHDGPDVAVEVGRTEDGFFVADDGPGIPPAKRELVFDQGYTTASSTGFGLAIVDMIARAHDWSVEITEGEDGDARFEFENVEFAPDPGGGEPGELDVLAVE